jgi:hypothetical protein
MRVQISPTIKIEEIGSLTLDRKIDIFTDRMHGWMFDAITEIDKIEFSGKSFAILKLSITIVELLAKYSSGELSKASKRFYINGLQMIFPNLSDDDGELFYMSIRNPLYHLGFPAPNVFVTFDVKYPFAIKKHMLIQINPRSFVEAVKRKFQAYLDELNNPKCTTTRSKFETRFDYDHSEIYDYLGGSYFDIIKKLI